VVTGDYAMAERIVFTEKQEVRFQEFELPEIETGMVHVHSLYSLISTGTETIVYNRQFDPNTHWDHWVKYPFYPGYSLIGKIVKVGSEIENLKEGDYVALRSSHASDHVVKAENCFPVPSEMDVKQATWFALAKIAFMGARVAKYFLGDSVLIIGAGPIGQMSIRWAWCAGVETIIVVDRIEKRLIHAQKGGATHVIGTLVEESINEIKQVCNGDLPNIVIDTTGNPEVFSMALTLVRQRGRIVVLGDTGYPAKQHLSSDVIMKGISIVGAHDSHNDREWDAQRIHHLFCNLVQSGRFSLEGLNTHVFLPKNCKDAYELANTRRGETMGMIFDWTKKS
jgi:2-desacetyl-2-hydroxyethyl bacteriochlorophyllide A dehydrogenase